MHVMTPGRQREELGKIREQIVDCSRNSSIGGKGDWWSDLAGIC
jgi:hypothetical protein